MDNQDPDKQPAKPEAKPDVTPTPTSEGMTGSAGFSGDLKIKVIRAKWNLWQWLIDFFRGHT